MTIRERHVGIWGKEVSPMIISIDHEGGEGSEYVSMRGIRVINGECVSVIESDGISGRVVRTLTGPAINSDPDARRAHIGWQQTQSLPKDLRRFHFPFWNAGRH